MSSVLSGRRTCSFRYPNPSNGYARPPVAMPPLSCAHADVSFATMFYPQAHIPAGPVTVRQIASLYIYENTLYAVEMTGAQLKAALEHAAGFFPAWPPAPPDAPLKLPGYNADSAAGVSYTIDLTRPAGDRVRNLQFRGRPVDPGQEFRVAINNYRYTGGGYYTVFSGLPVLYRSPVEVRELMIQYVTKMGKISGDVAGTWRIVPPEAVEAMEKQVAAEQKSRPPASGDASR